MFKEQTQGFFTFIREQGVVGLAVGFILGGAVSALVKSIVEDIINPLISSTIRDIDTLNSIMLGPVAFGSFISALIDFIVIAAVVYFIFRGLKLDRLDVKKDK